MPDKIENDNAAERAEQAVENFSEGYLCSQAVFSTYGPLYGIDEKQALKIATGFGGGMARLQEVCGAVTGAFMVIGAKHGMTDAADRPAVGKTYQGVRTFAERFRGLHGTIICKEILGGVDLNTEDGQKEFKEKNMAKTICSQCVRDAAMILEETD